MRWEHGEMKNIVVKWSLCANAWRSFRPGVGEIRRSWVCLS